MHALGSDERGPCTPSCFSHGLTRKVVSGYRVRVLANMSYDGFQYDTKDEMRALFWNAKATMKVRF